jgi:hypothetical protein
MSQKKIKRASYLSSLALVCLGLHGNMQSEHSIAGLFNRKDKTIKEVSNNFNYNISDYLNVESENNINHNNNDNRLNDLTEKADKYLKRFPITELPTNYQIDGRTIAEASIKYDIPLEFILAVGQIESRFLTNEKAVRGRKTKSIFGLGLYDNGQNVISYPNARKSVDDFAKHIHSNYLVEGRTINDLLTGNKGFVNLN